MTVEKVGYQSGESGSNTLTIKITARADFPARRLSGYYIKSSDIKVSIPELNPGESREVLVPVRGFEGKTHISIYKPTGFLTMEAEFALE